MKYEIDILEIETNYEHKSNQVLVTWNNYLIPISQKLEIDNDSFVCALKELSKGKNPTCLKLGSFWKGMRISFSGEAGVFYLGSITSWVFPFGFGKTYGHCFSKINVNSLIRELAKNA